MEPTSTEIDIEPNQTFWEKIVEIWEKHQVWIILAILFIFAIVSILTYCLCIICGCCHNKYKDESPQPKKFHDKHNRTSFEKNSMRVRARSAEMYSNTNHSMDASKKKSQRKIQSDPIKPNFNKMNQRSNQQYIRQSASNKAKHAKSPPSKSKRQKSSKISVNADKKTNKKRIIPRALSPKISPRHILSPSFGKRSDRNSYETIDSDDDILNDVELIPTRGDIGDNNKKEYKFHHKHRKHRKKHRKRKQNSNSTQYEAISMDPDQEYNHEDNQDYDPEEKQCKLDVFKRSINSNKSCDSDSSDMFDETTEFTVSSTQNISRELQDLHSMTPKHNKPHLKSINIKGIGKVATNNDGKPIIINIHHNHVMGDPSFQAYDNNHYNHVNNNNDKVIHITKFQRQSQREHDNRDNIPNSLPKLPPDLSETDTEIVGEGFNLDVWIKATLKECTPDSDDWKKYWNNFQKHKITEDTLIALSTDKHNKNDVWKELIPVIGPRIKFQEAWDKELLRQQQRKY